jgi:hypothetical protein
VISYNGARITGQEEKVTRPRAADDFAAIRERLEVLRRERARMPADDASDAPEKPGIWPTIRRASFA